MKLPTSEEARRLVAQYLQGEKAPLEIAGMTCIVPLTERVEEQAEEVTRLRELLLSYAEWCDSIATYDPVQGGQQVGTATRLQMVASQNPMVRREFREQAGYILEALA